MRILSRSDVEAALDLGELVDAVGAAMAELSAGHVSMPPRIAAAVPERDGLLAVMPAFLPASRALTTKLVSLFPQNRDRPTHQAIICCFDPATGTPVAVMDGEYITAMRTAAGSVLSAKLLARNDASVFAIIGTGVQARSHARILAIAFPQAQIVVAGRHSEAALRLRDELVGQGIKASAAQSIEEATRAADVVFVGTHADKPVLRYEWLKPGTHVASVGYNTAGEGEIDAETIRRGSIFVESRAAAFAPLPAGVIEIGRAIEAGTFVPEQIRGEIGELVAGTAAGRSNDEEVTVYKSVGVAVQDAAAAALVLNAAEERGLGAVVNM